MPCQWASLHWERSKSVSASALAERNEFPRRLPSASLRILEDTCSIFACSRFASEYLAIKLRQIPPRRKTWTSSREENSFSIASKRTRALVGSAHCIISLEEAVGSSARPSGGPDRTASPGADVSSHSEFASSAAKNRS